MVEWLVVFVGVILSLQRAINIKFPPQPYQKYTIAVRRT